MAFNRKIVDEAKEKLNELGVDWKKMQANTAHGFGVGAYRKARPDVVIEEYKVDNIIQAMMNEQHPLWFYRPAMRQLVSLAKQAAFGAVGFLTNVDRWIEMADHHDIFDDEYGPPPLNDIVQMCIKVLKESVEQVDIIDFDDMIYMPLIHKVRVWRHDVVMVDECQDTNAARRALVRAMLRPGGRVIAVGDPHQAIYGFTGADSDAIDLIARDFDCQELKLTVSFRCPQEVVKFAQQWVSHIEAFAKAPAGEVSETTLEEFMKREDLKDGAAVLCRNTKPLVKLAFALIRRRVACRVEGRDIGKALIKLMKRWKVKTLDALEGKLDKYLEREKTKLLAAKKESRLAVVEDSVETIRVIIDQCRQERKNSVEEASKYVQDLFGDNVRGMLVLSTIHRAKGREWPTVFWLDREGTCPSKYARQKWQQEQEKNLQYVAATRAQEQLIEVRVTNDIAGNKEGVRANMEPIPVGVYSS